MADVEDGQSEADLQDNENEEPRHVQFDEDSEEEGEEGCEEENGCFRYSIEEFIQKLKQKPGLPQLGPQGCGCSVPSVSYKGWEFPVGERLTVTTLNSLDRLKELIPFPRGCVPPLALPTWHVIPIDRKVPMVQAPKGLLYYTRGKMGETLLRKPVVWSLNDPYNRERVPGGFFTSLHDPHSKEYCFAPAVRALLRHHEFINDQDDVLCSLADFNRYREYLNTIYTDLIWKEYASSDALDRSERKQLQDLIRSESHEIAGAKQQIRSARVANAKRVHQESLEFKRRQAEQRAQISANRLREFQLEKERQIIEHILQGIEKQKKNTARLQALYAIQLQRKRNILTRSMRKFLEAEERRHNDKMMTQAAYNKFLLEWIESKYDYCYEKLIQKRQLQHDLTGNLKYRARQRQRRLEKYRELMPAFVEKKKAETARIWGIVRKYAMRWLNKVRAKLNAPKDSKHESCWIGSKNVLDDTVKYLYQESGYEKLDDFILNIMKLKKEIQHQIEMEEAEEAAAAAREAEEEEEHSDAEGVAEEEAEG